MRKIGRDSHFVRQLRTEQHTAGAAAGAVSVLAELRRAIIGGDVRAGSVIWVDEVAEAFGVSTIPVRESLKSLVGEGLVEHRPRGGYSVSWLSVDEYTELYVVCRSLELAAIPTSIERADVSDDDRLKAAHFSSQAALDGGDELGYQHEIKAFHLGLVAPARMSRVLAILETTWNMTELGQPMTSLSDAHRAQLHDEHAQQLDAFLSRDAPRLLRLTEEHYETLLADIQLLPQTDAFRGH